MAAIKLLGISGSLRKGSYSTALLRHAVQSLPAGVEVETADLSALPIYNEDLRAEGFPAAVELLREQIGRADALLISTPEYNRSLSPLLKNAIDWASRTPPKLFSGKPVGIISSSPGAIGGAFANHHLRQVMVYLDAWVLPGPEAIISSVHTRVSADGTITDPAIRDALGTLASRLAAVAAGRAIL